MSLPEALLERAAKVLSEAEALEASIPELRLTARVGATLSKRVPDGLAQDLQKRIAAGLLGPSPEAFGTFGAELIESFGDRLADFVEATLRQMTTNAARAVALREQAEALKAFALDASQDGPAAVDELVLPFTG